MNDVHIRYEDAEADPAQPFSIGVRLERVSVESADENWVSVPMMVVVMVVMVEVMVEVVVIVMLR